MTRQNFDDPIAFAKKEIRIDTLDHSNGSRPRVMIPPVLHDVANSQDGSVDLVDSTL